MNQQEATWEPERAMQKKHLGNLEGKMELNRNEQ